MEIKIISEKDNPLLKRKEVRFQVKHDAVATPPRLEIRKAVADALKTNVDLVFVKKFETRSGMHIAAGVANLYDSVDNAKLVEPEYIVKRNVPPPPKPQEEGKKE
jgi:small subunit ribosomal protein S24e